jgi:hypothetical protein
MLSATVHPHPTINAEELHRNAYNAAFCKLGLYWFWDADTYCNLLPISEERDRIRRYLESEQPHLLRAYDADFLLDAIEAAKSRFFDAISAGGIREVPQGNWTRTWGLEVGA